MNSSSPDPVVVVSALRTPICRAKKGSFAHTTPEVLLSAVLKTTLEQTGVDPKIIGDVVVGNVLSPGGGAAMARIAQILSGIPHTVPLSCVNRQCSSGLQAFANVAAAIESGYYEVGIAAGVESMSLDPMSQVMPTVDYETVKASPAARKCMVPMGVTSENVAEKYGISRETQDTFAAASHAKAAKAQAAGWFDAEIVPVEAVAEKREGDSKTKTALVTADDGIRAKTTLEGLSSLKPVFKKGGSTTAGNSSQMSDGAAAVLVMKWSKARELKLPVLAVLRGYSVVGVPPEIMGIGPAVAIPAALERAGVAPREVDVYEVNEAFASQATYCAQELGIPDERLNPKGGAIALGHPLGCTGARQIATLVHELARTDKRIGVVSMCIGTGMGAAAVFERPPPAPLRSSL